MTSPIRMVSVPVELVRFLLGEGSFDGRDFGDERTQTGGKLARYWWRRSLRECITAAPVREEGGVVDDVVDAPWPESPLATAIYHHVQSQFGLYDDEASEEAGEIINILVKHGVDPTKLPALATREEAPAEDAHPFVQSHSVDREGCCKVCGRTEDAHREASAEAGEIDLYDDKVQAGIAWTMRQWGETLGLKTWDMGDGSESVEGDVGAEIHTILADAGLRDPETNEMAVLRAQPQAREEAGPAEPEVGRAIYERIEKLLTDNPQGWERAYLSHLVASVEEVGGYDGPQAREEALPVLWTEDMERERREADYERGFRHGKESAFEAAGSKPVAWRGRDLDAFGDGAWSVCSFKPSCDVVEPLYTTPPAPEAEKLRVAVEALEAQEDQSKRGILFMTRDEVDRVTRLRREALSALQQEGR